MITQDDRAAYAAWLTGLQPGDQVGVDPGGTRDDLQLAFVQRVTAMRVSLKDGRDFRRTGQQAGTFYGRSGSFRIVRLVPWTDVAEHARQTALLAQYLSAVQWTRLPADTLRAIYDLVPKPTRSPE